MSRMHKLNKRASRKKFNSTANKTKAANICPAIKRGGIRA